MKQKIKNLLIILITIHSIALECQKGCLKCSKEDKCLICDQTDFYIKNEKAECEKKISENCEQINKEGECLNCSENYYLDGFKRKCVILENAKKIENCFSYDSSQNCLLCKPDFFFIAGVCKAVEKKIDNCNFYLNEEKCVSCKDGFLMGFEGKNCELIDDAKNCLYFSKVNCHTCNPGFIKNPNLFTKNLFTYNSDSDSDKIIDIIRQNDKNFQKKEEICEKTITLNCLEHETFDKCKICNPNYYLNEQKTCSPFPLTIIENCLQYTSNTKCKKCQKKHFLQSVFECIPVIPIEKCLEYNNSQNTTICTLCEQNLYSTGNKCENRNNSIKNCKELNPMGDTCKTCENGFILAEDNLSCNSVIANCSEYNFIESIFTCTKCNANHILENKICKQGSIPNCETYTESSTTASQTCEKCENKYKIENSSCIPFSSINKCQIYQNEKNCKKCEKGYFNFQIKKQCTTLTPIPNCQIYTEGSNPLTCNTCNSAHIPNASKNACQKMNVPNCHFGPDLDNCEICLSGYALKGTLCFSVLEHMGLNCEVSDVDQKNGSLVTNVLCESCKIHSLPVNHKDLFVCVRNENLVFYFGSVERCVRYDRLGNCLECVQGEFLDGLACVESCGAKDVKRYDFTGYKKNECLSVSQSCLITAPKIDSSGDICIKCKDGYIPVTLGYDNNNYTNFSRNLNETLIEDHREISYALNCVELLGKTINSGGSTTGLIPNCILYKLRDSTNYDCIKCADFYSGEITNNYITSCSLDSAFSTKKLRGLDQIWQKLFSSYECQNPNNIPFTAYIETSPTNPLPLKQTSINASKAQTAPTSLPQSRSTFCNINTSNYTLNESITIPTDCALGVYRLSPTSTFRAFHCAACKPGYKPTPHADASFFKESCELIAHCNGKDWFNGCSACSDGYVFKFDGDVDFATCWAYARNDHCFASADDGECVLCRKGFVLNADRICDRVLGPNCDGRERFSWGLADLGGDRFLEYKFFVQQGARGCQKCKFGYTQVLISTSNYYVCSKSEFIEKNSDIILDSSEFIRFCENYFYDGQYKCNKCKNTKLIDVNKKKCVNLMDGCLIASNNDNQCHTCQPEYALIKYTCIKSEILNCSSYYNNTNKESIICKECQNEYYKETNELSCIKSAVINCEKPTGLQKCSKCYDEYVLYNDLDFHYCFAMDSTLECKNGLFKDNPTYGGEISCEGCKKPNQIFITSENALIVNKTVCMEYNEIFKCKIYGDTGLLSTSTFYCLECEEGFYLSSLTGNCVKRKLILANCLSYSLTDDVCIECDENSFIDNDGKICQSFPKGVLGCIGYISEKECTKCAEDSYLTMNTCQKILETEKIENCKYYKSSSACKECKQSYVLEENLCKKSTISHCKTLKTSTECETCEEGYGLEKNSEKTECLSLTKPNCLSYNQNSPYACLKCKTGFFTNADGFCDEADPPINNCLIYKDKETCLKCENSAILSKDQKKCYENSEFTVFSPMNCEEVREISQFCTVCEMGYYLVGAVCEKCVKGEGCFACGEGGCFVCESGFFMDKEGKCVGEEVVEVQEETPVLERGGFLRVLGLVGVLFL